jgi:O-antigen/teichoic acid export membrane protein
MAEPSRPGATVFRNALANYASRGVSAVLSIVFPPLLIGMLGAESYGLVGLYASIAAVLGFLDLGLGVTLQREAARLSVSPESRSELGDLFRTHEVVGIGIGLLGGLAVAIAAPFIAHEWVTVESLEMATVIRAIRLMGVVFAFQWPGSVYTGALTGLQRQVVAGAVTVGANALRLGGGAALIWLLDGDIDAFFAWQVLTTAASTLVLRMLASRGVGLDASSAVRFSVIRQHGRFSAGAAGVAALAAVVTQLDKAVVGGLFTLADLGRYTLASNVANALYLLIGPIFTASFPTMCQAVQAGDEPLLARIYHESCQLMSVVLLPAASMLVLFAPELLTAWTNDAALAAEIAPLAIALAAGTAMNGLMNVPYGLQLAHGWTRLTLWTNAISALVLVPLVVMLGRSYGPLGAASGWTILNAGYVVVLVPAMHRRVLRGHALRWYVGDVLAPLAGAALVLLPVRLAVALPDARWPLLAALGVAGVFSAIAAGAMAPSVRARAIGWARVRLAAGR